MSILVYFWPSVNIKIIQYCIQLSSLIGTNGKINHRSQNCLFKEFTKPWLWIGPPWNAGARCATCCWPTRTPASSGTTRYSADRTTPSKATHSSTTHWTKLMNFYIANKFLYRNTWEIFAHFSHALAKYSALILSVSVILAADNTLRIQLCFVRMKFCRLHFGTHN